MSSWNLRCWCRLDVLSSYVAELSLLDVRTNRFMPSEVAASAVLLAQYCLSGARWNATLEHYTSYAAKDLRCSRRHQFVHNP